MVDPVSVELSLAGKIAIVTGGSRGIGAAIVRMFCAAGAQVLFNFQKAQSSAEEVVAACNTGAATVRCVAIQAELSGSDGAEAMVAAAINNFGRVDILVANHGIWPPQDVAIDQMTAEQWRRTMAINVDGVFHLLKLSVGEMKKQGQGGHIVIISSTAAQRGEALHCDYAASKGAVISMVKGLSTELAPYQIYVNCVAPGWVATDMAAPALADPVTSERVLRSIPLHRPGTPEEIAAPVLFLCTPHAGFITGEIFNVNGGAVLSG